MQHLINWGVYELSSNNHTPSVTKCLLWGSVASNVKWGSQWQPRLPYKLSWRSKECSVHWLCERDIHSLLTKYKTPQCHQGKVDYTRTENSHSFKELFGIMWKTRLPWGTLMPRECLASSKGTWPRLKQHFIGQRKSSCWLLFRPVLCCM